MKTSNPKYRYGFTLVELITTITILAVIAIVGFTYANNYKLSEYNVRRKADMGFLNATMNSYMAVKKIYPNPAGNKQYYDESWVYAHSSSWAYWVSWFITSEVLGKQFLSVIPKDPLTNNFYAYARTLWEVPTYQLATAFNTKWTYNAYVKWTYPGDDLSWIIKEYNWPNFVLNGSSRYLPYNTSEVKLVGKIVSYSWVVNVTRESVDVGTDTDLVEWDKVVVNSWWLATIYLSDGSELKLWSTTKNSLLDMNDLKYKEDNNLLTQVSLKLVLWEIWVKAPEMETWSEFTIETSNAAASVRWTVFGMTTDWASWTGTIELIEWKLELQKVNWTELSSNFNVLSSGTPWVNLIDSTTTWALRKETIDWVSKTIMEALPGNPIKISYTVSVDDWTSSLTSWFTWTITEVKIKEVMEEQVGLNEWYLPKLSYLNKTLTWLLLGIENMKGNYYEVKLWSWYTSSGSVDSSSWVINVDISFSGANEHLNLADELNLVWRICSLSNSWIENNISVDWEEIYPNQRMISNLLFRKYNPTISRSFDGSRNNIIQKYSNICSSWSTLGISPNPISWTKEDIYWEVGDEVVADVEVDNNNWCLATEYMSEITDECEDEVDWMKLVGFAGFDSVGDLGMSIWSNTVNKITPIQWNIIWNTVSYSADITNVTSYNTWNSFVTMNNWTKWIFIDNNWTDDLLKYDISSILWTNATASWFAIEMSVRGGALKRSSGTYYLYNVSLLDWKKIYLEKYNWNLILWYYYSSYYNNLILISNSNFDNLEDNTFYKIKTIFNWTEWKMDIVNTSINWLSNTWIISNPADIYIWSKATQENQWNDIIDYLKIYRY